MMKSQQRRRRARQRVSTVTVATAMTVICTSAGRVGGGNVAASAAAQSSSPSSSSIRGGGVVVDGGTTAMTYNGSSVANDAAAVVIPFSQRPRRRQQQLRHPHSMMQQQQQQRSLQANSDGENNGSQRQNSVGDSSSRHNRNTSSRHRKSDNPGETENDPPQQQQQPSSASQRQYSWNVNPDKLQAMLAATTASDSDRQGEDDPTTKTNDDDNVNVDDDDSDETDESNNNNMTSMSAAFVNAGNHDQRQSGTEAPVVNGNGEDVAANEEQTNDDQVDDDNGIGIPGLSVYSLSTTTPTTTSPSVSATSMPVLEKTGIAEGPSVYYFPIWSFNVQGCTSSTTPPDKYLSHDDTNKEESQYLFNAKLDCCSIWFQKLEDYEACLDTEIDLTQYPVAMKELGMKYEVVEKERDDDDNVHDDMIALSATTNTNDTAPPSPTDSTAPPSPTDTTAPPSPRQSQPSSPTREQTYYPTNYPGDAPSPQSQPLPNQEQGYYPANFPGGDAPAPSPQSQPSPSNEGGYYPANYQDKGAHAPSPTNQEGYYPANYQDKGAPAPSPQSQPSPSNEGGYYPANFNPDAPPAPSDSATATTTAPTEEGEVDAISGDSVISDLVLEAKLNDDTIMPALKLQSSPDDGTWEIIQNDDDYDGGKYVLSANTRKVILGMAANARGITTYQGQAVMSVTIMAGPAGGLLTFETYSKARAPIEVLQVKVDDLPMIAVTSPSSEWVEQTLEIPQGKHVVTFEHISNPENLSMKELEGLGKPGSSMVDGMKYADNVGDPLEQFTSSAVSEGPTSSPSSESDDDVTVDDGAAFSGNVSSTAVPMQNYCGKTLGMIQETCYTADAPPTCNDGDGPCPEGLFCWGNVECQVPEGDVEGGLSASASPSPTNATLQVITSLPTSSPTGKSSESFLDSFIFGSNEDSQPSSTNQAPLLENDAQEQSKPVGCLEGFPPVQGLAGCCVPEPSFLGDGACDAHAPYNTVECGYDLGDCCRESCDTETQFGCKAKEGDAYGPFGFYCVDPQYSTVEESCTSENREWIGDGGCDEEFNTQACGWDGGDCCQETCDTEFAYYECGREEQPFNCLDPNIINQLNFAPGKI